MILKTTFAALVLALAPTLSVAEGCGWEKKMNASSCAEGQTLDHASGKCVDKTTS
ncbi:hypothetical protein C8N32_1368 [Rhodovulum imhoffii]|uniref:Uncharacterized protein n=1 Tax=Rhodovulum imhoffii TaxID=365340 RepID=A0A2T5BLB4_9RHOB|nr:hypothetical protein [Rhodovulum imhoffii]PTM99705.1 hypothetical protein C8N32_1368 [Rhodovulum imhoffii]